jgi:hypothetical protein
MDSSREQNVSSKAATLLRAFDGRSAVQFDDLFVASLRTQERWQATRQSVLSCTQSFGELLSVDGPYFSHSRQLGTGGTSVFVLHPTYEHAAPSLTLEYRLANSGSALIEGLRLDADCSGTQTVIDIGPAD